MGIYRIYYDKSEAFRKYHVIVFTNVLFSEKKICETWDLKGRVPKPGKMHRHSHLKGQIVLKDNDLDRHFYFGDKRDYFIDQLTRDVEFLKKHNIMDYSLLIGVHYSSATAVPSTYSEYEPSPEIRHNDVTKPTSSPNLPILSDTCSTTNESPEQEIIAPRKSIFQTHYSGFYGAIPPNEMYFVGIIDCLTFYGMGKIMANSFKSFLWEKGELSTVDAEFYAERFLKYMTDIIRDKMEISELQSDIKNPSKLFVEVVRGQNLTNRNLLSLPYPYVIISFAEHKQKTFVKVDTLNPQWDEKFEFDFNDKWTPTVTFSCYDNHSFTKDQFIGVASVDMTKEKLPFEGAIALQTDANNPHLNITGSLIVKVTVLK